MNGPRVIDQVVTVAAAVAAPLLPLLIRHHVLDAQDAQDIGAVVLAAVGAYHGGRTTERRRRRTTAAPEQAQ